MVTLPNGEKIDKDVLIIKQFTELEIEDVSMLSQCYVGSNR